MRRSAAAAGSAAFFLAAPGVVAGLVPWWLTGWDGDEVPVWSQAAGWALVGIGLVVLVPAFVRFAMEGLGTPAPVAPTEHLVIGGWYRHVRNPMYLAVLAIILGQALILNQLVLLGYGAAVAVAVVAFVHGYEEPTLQRQFGADYIAYRRAVPAWRPRLRRWTPNRPGSTV